MRLRRFARDGAQTLVEFALILPLMLLIVTGLFDMARAVFQENTLAFAAREASRYAIVHGSASASPAGPAPLSDQAVKDQVAKYTIGLTNVTVTVTWPDGNNNRNSRVQVVTTAPFVPLPSQFFTNAAFQITLRGGSSLVIQR